jgi:hypothetical protein
MKAIKHDTSRRGTNLAVFLLFFLVALLEAIRTSNAFETLFWLSVGTIFLFADFKPRRWWRE